jgi:DNA (cytosine-5)-methyltransferase 1
MAMPETAMHKYAKPVFRHNDVGLARQPLVVQHVSEPCFVQNLANNQFRPGILSGDARHPPGAGRFVNDVTQGRSQGNLPHLVVMNVQHNKPIPIIDLFAGPGGLGEGFSSVTNDDGSPAFRIGLSIEKERSAHKTLTLRAVFRQLRAKNQLQHYFNYVRGLIEEHEFRAIPEVAHAYDEAAREAHRIELGKDDPTEIDAAIERTLNGEKNWLLIGGPPCQAYSLAGRARRTNDVAFESDEKHFLYREYLRIIKVHQPAVFVMENVKGLLTSKHAGEFMFGKILGDLSRPADGVEYDIRSFVKHTDLRGELGGEDYVIKAEEYGIPQARHRVILLGVRRDLKLPPHHLLQPVSKSFSVEEAICDLPKIRSRLSTKNATLLDWKLAVEHAPNRIRTWINREQPVLLRQMETAAQNAIRSCDSAGSRFIPSTVTGPKAPEYVQRWFTKDGPGGYLQHESRSHMGMDLARYLFAATYARHTGVSPRLNEFPPGLLPEHRNAKGVAEGGKAPFMDRFRVQLAKHPSTTVVSHIAKDGHYYIHYDPTQCRSLTVREAARLQTFPDNYFFEGNRTEQYTQVGNAVPPLLAFKIGQSVRGMMAQLEKRLEKGQ